MCSNLAKKSNFLAVFSASLSSALIASKVASIAVRACKAAWGVLLQVFSEIFLEPISVLLLAGELGALINTISVKFL